MGKIERVTVAMPEEMADRLRAAVDSGEYATTSEIVREALREWSDEQQRRQDALTRLRAEIDKGLAGPFKDAEEVFAELRAYVAEQVRTNTTK